MRIMFSIIFKNPFFGKMLFRDHRCIVYEAKILFALQEVAVLKVVSSVARKATCPGSVPVEVRRGRCQA